MSVVGVASTVGSVSSPWVAQWLRTFYINMPFYLMAAVSFLGAAACFFLPETTDRPTKEVIEDMFEGKIYYFAKYLSLLYVFWGEFLIVDFLQENI